MATGLLPEMSVISSHPDDPVIRILLMGRRRSGKSSSGNTILGERKFKVKRQETEVCDELSQIGEKQVYVIDCPDLLDPNLNEEKLEKMKEQLVSRCSSGLSAVLLTVPLEQPLENEEESLDFIICLLGPKIKKYIMVLFTHGDELEELNEPQTTDEYLQNQEHADLQLLVTECGGRFHCFNNKCKVKGQVQDLLKKIERMMEENAGKFVMEQMRRCDSKETCKINFSEESSPAEDPGEIEIPEKKDKIRLVLLGKTGAGKSATGNTILGKKVFKSFTSSNSQTKQCRAETAVRIGKQISVIDTPGLYDNELSKDEIKTEILKCITYSSPGPHVFIIVIKVGRFTKEEKNTIEELKETFGQQMEKYTMILFTHKDQLKEDKQTIEQYLLNGDPDLQTLVKNCGNRFFCLDNNSDTYQQFKDLLSKIETMVEENRGMHFTNDMFDKTEKHIQEIQKQKLDEKVKQYKHVFKVVSQTEWQKIFWRLAEDSRREAEQSFSDMCITAVAKLMGKIEVTPEEKESALKEAEIKGFSHTEALRLAIKATGTLAKQKICEIQ